MATDPNLLMHLVNAPGLAAQSVFAGAEQAQAKRQNDQQYRLGEQTFDINKLKMAAAQRQQEQQQQYQADVSGYFNDPRPEKLAELTAKYPEQADALKQTYTVMDGAQRTSRQSQFGSMFNAANNGRVDLVKSQLESLKTAEKAQGVDTSEVDDALEMLGKDPKTALKHIAGFAQIHLSAIDPEKFASTLGALGKGTEGFTLGPGMKRYASDGSVIAEAPFAPRPVTVKDGESVIEYQPGGGDPASGGGGSSGRYTGGWTPRARNGGDNDDAAVDNKIAGAAQSLGVGPDDSLSGKSPMDIARAMTLSEGGKGSLADRNNNPGNMRNGDGSYKKFATKEEGLRAAAALVARKMKAGQTTVRSMIEGLPAGGQSGARVIAQGAPKPGYQILTPQETAQIAGLDPGTVYQRSPDGQITAVGGQNRAQLKPIPPAAVAGINENRATLRQIDAAIAAVKSRPGSIGPGTGMLGDTFTQFNDPKGTGTRASVGKIGGQIIHDVSGAAVTLSEAPRFKPYVPLVTDRPQVALEKLKQLRQLAMGNLNDLNSYYSEAQGYRADARPTSAPVRVRTIQQAQKLAPGTLYTAPDGKVRRR